MACSGSSCSGTSYSVSGCSGGTCTASGYNGCYYACQGSAHGNCSSTCTGCTSSCGGSCSGGSSGSGGGGGGGGCTSCTGCGDSCSAGCGGCSGCTNACDGCSGCGGSCSYNCSTGCEGTCINNCNRTCGSLCTGGAKISINNLALKEYMEAQNIEDIYNSAVYENNRRSSSKKSEIEVVQYSSIDRTLINNILAMTRTLGSSLNNVTQGEKAYKSLGNNIITTIKKAWEKEI